MQHKVKWTLFNAVIGQSIDTHSYTVSCVYIKLYRLKIFKTCNTTYSGLYLIQWSDKLWTLAPTQSAVYIWICPD